MPAIPEALVAEFERGLSIAVGTRDEDLRPDGTTAWAASVHADREHLTVYLHEGAGQAMLRNLERYPQIAVLFERPTIHQGWQVKGRFVSARPAREDERAEVQRQAQGFREELLAIGIPLALSAQWTPWPCLALELRAHEIFEQSPGPGAGEPLR